MSDYIDELVREHWDAEMRTHEIKLAMTGNATIDVKGLMLRLASAVAARVKASARVCSWCHGSGLHPGPYDDVPTCDRCAGRGVTFGGEA